MCSWAHPQNTLFVIFKSDIQQVPFALYKLWCINHFYRQDFIHCGQRTPLTFLVEARTASRSQRQGQRVRCGKCGASGNSGGQGNTEKGAQLQMGVSQYRFQ